MPRGVPVTGEVRQKIINAYDNASMTLSFSTLAARFGVSTTTATNIIKGHYARQGKPDRKSVV